MADPELAQGVNDNHRRALTSTFRHIDEILVEIEAVVAGLGSSSPFAEYVQDLTPTQRQVVMDSLNEVRKRMAEILDRIGAESGGRKTSASWSILNSLTFAGIALDDSRPARLNGYGQLSPDAAKALEAILGDLARSVSRVQTYLRQGLGKDLSSRLARLEKAPFDIGLLRALEEIVTRHGLVEFQATLASLIERAESRTFEVAVFGRVSTGKSSLLNAVLEIDALPVGVTPITAVPTRITWGEKPTATIWRGDGAAEEIVLARLVEFVSERENPSNKKHVARVLVRVPSRRLREGIVLVDTPGVGSLATMGERETFAYLPRCDLGVILVDAGGSPGREDLEPLRRLYDSGVPANVLLSKGDLLAEPDRERMIGYLEKQIRDVLGLETHVRAVSTQGEHVRMAHEWFASDVEPLFARARELGEASARRKLAHLRESVVAALETMLGARSQGESRDDARARVEVLAARAEEVLLKTEKTAMTICENARRMTDRTLELAAQDLAKRWLDEQANGSPTREIVRRWIVEVGERVALEVQKEILEARDELRKILMEMADTLALGGARSEELEVDLLGRPAFTLPREVDTFEAPAPRARVKLWIEFRARSIVEERLRAATEQALTTFGYGLRDWVRGVVSALGERFAVHSEPLRSQARRLAAPATGDAKGVAEDLKRLAELAAQAAARPSSERDAGLPMAEEP